MLTCTDSELLLFGIQRAVGHAIQKNIFSLPPVIEGLYAELLQISRDLIPGFDASMSADCLKAEVHEGGARISIPFYKGSK